MFRLRLLAYALLCILVVACGGGTTASKSKFSARIKLDLESINKQRNKTESRIVIGSTLIGSVIVGYGKGETSTFIEVIDNLENDEEVIIQNLEAGETYVFDISAFDNDEEMVCFGEASTQIIPSLTPSDVTLECTFKDKYAVENLVYDLISKATANKLDPSELQSRVAGSVSEPQSFGMHNGMDREQYIEHLLNFKHTGFLHSSDSLSGVVLTRRDRKPTGKTGTVTEIEESAGYLVKFIYTDGSYEFDDITFVKEDNVWKIKGNGLKYGIKARPVFAEVFVMSESGVKVAGLSLYKHYGLNDVDTVSVNASGIEPGNYVGNPTFDEQGIYIALETPYFESAPVFLYPLDSNIMPFTGSFAENTPVNIAVKDLSSSTVNETFRVLGGYAEAELDSAEFPAITPLKVTGGIGFNITLPSWARRLEFRFEGHDYSEYILYESRLSIQSPSFEMPLAVSETGSSGEGMFTFTAYDSRDRAYAVYMDLSYVLQNFEDDSDPSGSALGSGLASVVGQDYYGSLYGANITYAAYDSGTSSISMAASTPLTSAYSTTYNPVVMKISYGRESASVVSRLIKFSMYQDSFYNAKTMTLPDGSVLLLAGISGYGAVAIRINSDFSAVDWVRTYKIGADDFSAVFKDAVLTENAAEIVLLVQGISGQHEKAYVMKLSAATGQLVTISGSAAAKRLSSGSDATVSPIKLAVIKGYTVVLAAHKNGADSQVASYRLTVLDENMNYVNTFQIKNNAVVYNIDMAEKNGVVYIAYDLKDGDLIRSEFVAVDMSFVDSSPTFYTANFRTVKGFGVDTMNSTDTKIAVTDNYIYLSYYTYDSNPMNSVYSQVLAKYNKTTFNLINAWNMSVFPSPTGISAAPLDSVYYYSGYYGFNISSDGFITDYMSLTDVASGLSADSVDSILYPVSLSELNTVVGAEPELDSTINLSALSSDSSINMSVLYFSSIY